MEGVVIYLYLFLAGYHPEVFHDVRNGNPVEVINLASAEDGRDYLVLFSGREDEDGVCRRFLQGLEEGVEGRGGQHVDLVYDVHAVLSYLRRNHHLLGKGADVVYGVVGGGIKFMDAVGTALVKRPAALALSARLHVLSGIHAVDDLCKDPGGGGLTYASWTAEQICMCKLPSLDGVLEGGGYAVLAYECPERCRAIFSGRNYEFFHSHKFNKYYFYFCHP